MKHNTMIVNVRNIRAGYAIHRIGLRIFSFFVFCVCVFGSYKNGLNYSFCLLTVLTFSVLK